MLMASAALTIMAVAAIGGGLGLLTGRLDLGNTVIMRLPLQSPAVGGTALLVWVGVPMAVAAALVITRSRNTDVALISAGGLLLEWIAIEIAVIRTFSWLQVVCCGWALILIILGVQLTDLESRYKS
jgi:hypothetical protein